MFLCSMSNCVFGVMKLAYDKIAGFLFFYFYFLFFWGHRNVNFADGVGIC